MRTVKFRGKRLDNGEWLCGDLIENQGRFFIYHATSETTIEDNDDGRIVVAAVEVDPATVGQYTGLKDKNGEEIFEGDIVKWENLMKTSMRSVIRYIYNGFRFTDFDGEDQEIWCYSFEVIGNIHDNPELMKGGKL